MVRLSTFAAASFALLFRSFAAETDAPVVEGNPDGAQYIATISKAGLNALIVAETPLNGRGVHFTININGPNMGAENYIYHLHELPVPEDGNCTATKAHLDPYKRGEDPICDKSQPHTCQVGDLSGKHGDIPTLPGFSANYTDDYVSLIPDTEAFMGDKSFVLHFPNKTRIACANFKLVEKDGGSGGPAGNETIGGGNGGAVGSGSSTNSSTSLVHTSHLPTSSPTFNEGNSPRPSGSAIPQEGSAKKMTPAQHAAVIGPLVFGVAAAVW